MMRPLVQPPLHSVPNSRGTDNSLKALIKSLSIPRSHGFRRVLTANFKISEDRLPETVGSWDGEQFPSKYQNLVRPTPFWDGV